MAHRSERKAWPPTEEDAIRDGWAAPPRNGEKSNGRRDPLPEPQMKSGEKAEANLDEGWAKQK